MNFEELELHVATRFAVWLIDNKITDDVKSVPTDKLNAYLDAFMAVSKSRRPVYTSSFSNMARLNTDDYTLVSIAQGDAPVWFPHMYYHYKMLAPDWSLIGSWRRGECSWEAYTKSYICHKNLPVALPDIILALEKLSHDNDDKPVVLLCFEGKGKHCHRHIIGDMIGAEEL